MTSPKYVKKKITLPMPINPGQINHRLSIITALVMLTLGCVPDNEMATSTGMAYFPLRIGDYRIYQVNETTIAPYNIETASAYQIKTVVTDSFKNAENHFTYIVSRFKRANDSDPWESMDTWTARADEQRVVVQEDNTPFVKLTFPVILNREWNGNAYNNLEPVDFCEGEFTSCDVYTFDSVQSSFETDGGLIFENTVVVNENDFQDIFTREDVRQSVYAWQVGLVYQEVRLIQYCTNDDCYGKQKIEDGLIRTQELIEYGND
jgi:hypothetical protein